MKLAAKHVEEISNGFTARPRPFGKINTSEPEIRGFGTFLLRNLIAIPYYEKDRAVFSLGMTLRHRLGLTNEYDGFSYVCFYYEGRIL